MFSGLRESVGERGSVQDKRRRDLVEDPCWEDSEAETLVESQVGRGELLGGVPCDVGCFCSAQLEERTAVLERKRRLRGQGRGPNEGERVFRMSSRCVDLGLVV